MLPHERALVKRVKDQPFALLGINSDPPDKLKQILADNEITWRQAVDGSTSGPLATKWNVKGWPTLYLVDAKGVIREHWLGPPGDEVLDKAIDAALAAGKTN